MAKPKHNKNNFSIAELVDRDPTELTFWQRLQIASEYSDIPCSPTDIARELGVRASAVTKYVNGGFPQKDKLNALATVRGVRSEWLLSGIGEMIAEESLDKETLELLKLWRTLDSDAKGRLLANLRYESIASENQNAGQRQALVEQLIKLLSGKRPS